MQKFTDFLLSLVSPLKMARFRTMSVLIAIIIFLLSVQIIYFPFKEAILRQGPVFEQDYTLIPLKDLPDDEEVNQFAKRLKDMGCAIDKNKRLVCDGLEDGELVEETFVFHHEETGYTKKLHFFIDYYIEEEPQLDINKGFESKDYPYVENEEDYFVVLTPAGIYYQAFTMLDEDESPVKHGDRELICDRILVPYAIYKEFSLTIDEPEAYGYQIGPYLARKIVEGNLENDMLISIKIIFWIVFLMPLIFIFMFWLVFKRTGRLKYFKEYYNIAAISSIAPLLLTFVAAWFLPAVINWYIFIFAVYYIYVLYRINNAPDAAEKSLI
ncbi:MAG: hypothetical protein WBI24_03370 [Bacilli bacterium]